MNLDINPRGNGACPICIANGDCSLQRRLAQSVSRSNGPGSEPNGGETDPTLEIVVYTCPYFHEKG
jgi:hypothetical protein